MTDLSRRSLLAHILWPYSGCDIREIEIPHFLYCFQFFVWRFSKELVL
jgi:hypothetical protein